MRINNSETFYSKHEDAKDIAMDYLQNKLEAYGLIDLNEFKIRKVAKSLTGEFVYFDQYIKEIPVYQTNFTIFISKDKVVRFVSNEFRNISKERLIASLPIGVGLRGTSVEDKSVKEGCSFYWPTSYKLSISNYRWDEFALWVNRGGSWWVANYSLKYPNNFVNNLDNAHNNGLIFSAALLKIRENIVAQTTSLAGRDIADKLFLEMHYRWNQYTNFHNAANAYLESSKYYDNGKWYCLVFNTLNSFGLIANINTTHQITGTFTSSTTVTDVNINMQNVTISSGTVKVKACNDVNLENVIIKSGATLEIEAGGSFRINYATFIVEANAKFIVL